MTAAPLSSAGFPAAPLAGYADARGRGRVRVNGPDAAAFLHALVSNDVSSLARGRGCYATYLTPQGRLLADMRIYHRGDHLLLDVAPGTAADLAARLDQLVFSEDVAIVDVSADSAALHVVGPGAPAAIAAAFGLDAGALALMQPGDHRDIAGGIAARTDDAVVPSFDVFVQALAYDEAARALEGAGVTPITAALVDALRIDAGRPLFGVDMTSDTIPLEAGLLDRAISQTKGCYVGQEVIVRVLHRGGGRVARVLVKLDFGAAVAEPPLAGSKLTMDDREVGAVTSAAMSPSSGRAIALAYVKRDDAEVGRVVRVGGAPATIVSLAG